ncbi:MAG TPA: signal peptidase I, partial [Acidimicrobiales bacterium]|nr:signal peptidase I [Acidimicrobiales bacterium]
PMTTGPPQPAPATAVIDGEPAEPSRPRRRRWLVEWGIIVVLAVVVAVVVRAFVFQTFYIPSTSMYPTLKAGDRIIVSKLSYHLHTVGRGDVIVFSRPPTEHCGGPPVPDLVKRVIGLPGDTISAQGGQVYIDGKLLPEPWLPKVSSTYTSNFGPLKVPTNEYFMMGDNRVDSCDSRYWGPIERTTIVGKVVLRIWPISQVKFF